MTLVALSSVAVQYGAEPLLDNVNLAVEPGERWGLIGRNGSGKSSLFRVIAGMQDPAAGVVTRAPGLRVALLDQHRDFGDAATVWDAACTGFADLLALERALHQQAVEIGRLGDRVGADRLARYDRDLERFGREGGYGMEARVSAVLQGLGFEPEAARLRPLASLSGGERGRLGLACQLVTEADLLLLDEPTNHLDLETTEWLVGHLGGLAAGLVVVSHDRAFLDAVVDHVLHLEAGTAAAYAGGYTAFVTQRTELRLARERAWQKQARVVAAEEDYIRRNIAGGNSRQAKGRRRRLTRLPRLSPPPADPDAMAVRFPGGARGGDQVLVAEDLRLELGDRVLLDRFSGVVRRGDVIGLVGPNGAGKSTLLATLLGDRAPAAGRARLGDGIAVEVYRQDLSQVPRDRTLFDLVQDRRPSWNRGQVLGHLARYDFAGDAVLRRADSLSGGELARVALALMTLAPANFLVFDEPTNHLDVESIEALEDAVEIFDGTVLLVSHDRALLRSLCTRIWSLAQGRLTDYGGGFADWEASRAERRRVARAAEREAEVRRPVRKPAPRPSADRTAERQSRRARRALEAAEARVQELEVQVARATEALAAPELYATPDGAERAVGLARELEAMKAELDAAFGEWEASVAEVERVTRES